MCIEICIEKFGKCTLHASSLIPTNKWQLSIDQGSLLVTDFICEFLELCTHTQDSYTRSWDTMNSNYISAVNPCTINNGGCEQICRKIGASFQCSCLSGYILSANGRTCDGNNKLWFITEIEFQCISLLCYTMLLVKPACFIFLIKTIKILLFFNFT